MKLTETRLANLVARNPKKSKKGKCQARRCPRSRSRHDPLCPRCRKHHDKATDPARYTYNVTKSNAKKRGKEFTITLEYFRKLCEETGYLQGKGRLPDSLTLDRIKSNLGYIEGNIRVISHSINSAKGNRDTIGAETDELPF